MKLNIAWLVTMKFWIHFSEKRVYTVAWGKNLIPVKSFSDKTNISQKKNIHVELYEEMICAGYKNKTVDACLGDRQAFRRLLWHFGALIDNQTFAFSVVAHSRCWTTDDTTCLALRVLASIAHDHCSLEFITMWALTFDCSSCRLID